MRQTLSKGMLAAAAATSILSLYGSPALADTQADGIAKGSPGLLSGNTVQAPVDAPVNICGNSVDVAGALNPAFGNACANESAPREEPSHPAPHRHDSSYGDDDHTPMPKPTHTVSSYGDDDGPKPSHTASSYGDGDQPTPTPTPPSYGEHTPKPTHTPPAYGDDQPTPTPTPPSYGDHTPKPSHKPPSYGDHTPKPTHTPPSYGEHTPPPGDHHTPPPGDHTPPPSDEHTPPPTHHGEHPGHPPVLAHTGSEAMLAASAAGAVLIAGGAILYRRGRAASRR